MEKHSREKISMEEYKKILLMILEKIDNLIISNGAPDNYSMILLRRE